MNTQHELTIEIEETETGEYRARVTSAPDGHAAVCDDPGVAVRGAVAVARGALDEAVGYDRTPHEDKLLAD